MSAAAAVQPAASAGFGLRLVLTLGMTLPMLILYAIGALGPFLVRDLGIAPGWLGYLTMSTFGLAALLSLGAGPLVERLGSRRGLGVLFHSVALAYGLIVAAPGFAGVVAAVALCGVAQALSNPVTNLLIAQRVPPAQKAFVVGLKQAGVQLGALFAGLVLPALASQWGWRAALGSLIPLALALGFSARLLAPPPPAAARGAFTLPRPNALLRRLMAVQCCVGVTLSAFVTFLPVFATRQGVAATQAGLMVALFGAMGIASRVVLTPLGARLRDESVLLLGLLVLSAAAVGVTRLADPASHWTLWLGAAALGLTAVATNAIAMGMLLRSPVFGTPATASGLLSAAFFGGFAVGPPAFGMVANSAAGFDGAWLALVGVVLLGCLAALALIHARRRSTP